MHPSLSLLPLSLPSFWSSIYRFLSPSPLSLSPSPHTPSSFAPWSRSVSAFIDRSQNDLAHVSYSSWRSGVGGLDFSSLSPFRAIFSSFPRGGTRRDATRTASLRCRDDPRPLPVVDSPLRVSLTSRVNRCAIVATRSHINPGY